MPTSRRCTKFGPGSGKNGHPPPSNVVAEEVARTVATPMEVNEELRNLRIALRE
jgi:hypothetical protein